MDPATVRPRHRGLAWGVMVMIALVFAGYLAFQVAFIILHRHDPPVVVSEREDFGNLPNFLFCPYSRNEKILFAYGYTWISAAGLIYANGTIPPREHVVPVEVRWNPRPADVAPSAFDQYNKACAYVNSSILKPQFERGNVNELEVSISFEVHVPEPPEESFLGLRLFAEEVMVVPSWGKSSGLRQVLLASLDSEPVVGKLQIQTEVGVTKSSDGWITVFGNDRLVTPKATVHSLRLLGPYPPPEPLLTQLDNVTLSNESFDSPKLRFVNVVFDFPSGRVEHVDKMGVLLQLMGVLSRAGGFVTIAGLVFSVVFIRAYPKSDAAITYDMRTPFWDVDESHEPPKEHIQMHRTSHRLGHRHGASPACGADSDDSSSSASP